MEDNGGKASNREEKSNADLENNILVYMVTEKERARKSISHSTVFQYNVLILSVIFPCSFFFLRNQTRHQECRPEDYFPNQCRFFFLILKLFQQKKVTSVRKIIFSQQFFNINSKHYP